MKQRENRIPKEHGRNNTNAPAVSVICSAYNAEIHLQQYLASVNEQKLKNFEIIFINAGSQDNTSNIIDSYSPRKGITKKVVHHDNRIGIYQAWNEGIRLSSSPWVINYNCDDHLFQDALKTLIQRGSTTNQPSVVYADCLISNSPDHKNITGICQWRDASLPKSLELGCCCGPFPLVSKDLYRRHGLFLEDFKYSGDYEMWCRFKAAGVHFEKVSLPLGIYYANPDGLSTSRENQERRKLEDLLAKRSLTTA